MNQLQTNQKSISKNYLYPHHCFILLTPKASFKERNWYSFKYYSRPNVLWVHAFSKGHWKGGWEFEAAKHGKLMSKQVNVYQEIQSPGMDVVPYTLPVYPHPASQQYPFLRHSLSNARGPRALSEETWPWRACRNHLSRMSQDTSGSHVY